MTDAVLLRELESIAADNVNRHLNTTKGLVPARLCAVAGGPQFRGHRRPGLGAGAVVTGRGGPCGDDHQSADRGQSAVLPPRGSGQLLPGRPVGCLGEPLDRRGEPARHRHPRLPGGHPRRSIWVRWSGPGWSTSPTDSRRLQEELAKHDSDFLMSVSYVTFQELATRVSHRNTGKVCDDPIADRLLRPDRRRREPAHDLLPQYLQCGPGPCTGPDRWTRWRLCVENFRMPGQGMPDFRRNGVMMAKHGIYDLRQHMDEVVMPMLRKWRIFERTDFERHGRGAPRATGHVPGGPGRQCRAASRNSGTGCWPARRPGGSCAPAERVTARRSGRALPPRCTARCRGDRGSR